MTQRILGPAERAEHNLTRNSRAIRQAIYELGIMLGFMFLANKAEAFNLPLWVASILTAGAFGFFLMMFSKALTEAKAVGLLEKCLNASYDDD